MSTLNEDLHDDENEQDDQLTEADELKLLKERATLMGIKFSNNISVATLKEKIEERMTGTKKDEAPPATDPELKANPLDGVNETPVKKKSLRKYLFEREMKLVRVRITCMDPKKAELHGEVLCVSNEYLGNVKKFIPYGEATEGGFHIEHCLYQTLKDREFLQIRTLKGDKSNGMTPRIETKWVREFAIEVLPPLTAQELADLKVAQIAAGTIDAAK